PGHRGPAGGGGAGGDRGAPPGGGGMSPTLTVHGPAVDDAERVLPPAALAFVADLARRFEPRRRELLDGRRRRQEALRGGTRPDFLPETRAIREGDWTVTPAPDDLQDRRVEITP